MPPLSPGGRGAPGPARVIEEGPPRLVLRKRAGALELTYDGVVLLSSAALETERAFGRLVERVVAPGAGPRVLIGGLGFGATLRGALDTGGPRTRVTVVERVAAVGRLVAGELAHLEGATLADPRVDLVIGDAADVLAAAPASTFDAILLDVDNGPDWASFRTNARLYTPAGLRAALRALAPGGLYAVWSGYPRDAFLAELRVAGFSPALVPLHEGARVRARAYVGKKPR
jgi:spermidine synthase